MRTSVKTLIAASALGAASIAGVQPAEARDHTGAAVVAGIVGLGLGAAIASSGNHGSYYGNGYYDAGYQPYGYGYYGSPTVVYDSGYYRGYRHDNGWHRGWDRDRNWDRGRRDHDRRDWDQDRDWRR